MFGVSWDVLREIGGPRKRTHMLQTPGLQKKSLGPADQLCFSFPSSPPFWEVEWVGVLKKISTGNGVVLFLEGRQIEDRL